MRLSTITEAAREAQATEVFKLVESGITVREACQSVGITPRQYNFWMARSSMAIDAIKGMIAEQERSAIIDIIQARDEAIRKITEAVYTENNVVKLMQIESHLRALQGGIEDRHGISSMDRSAADFMLTGPSTKVEESRTTVSIKPTERGVNIDIASPEIIDLTPNEDD